MWGLSVIDWVVIGVYLVGITLLGAWMARRVKNLGDFLMPRRYGKAYMVMYAFGAGTNSDVAVVVAAKIFVTGISGIWYTWCYLFATPFYWLVSALLRRSRAYTMADVYRLRFDGSLESLYAVFSTLKMSLGIGLMLLATGKVVAGSSDGQIPSEWVIGVVTILFLLYGTLGGLSGAIVTDLVQGFMIIIFSFMLLPMVLGEIGGLSAIGRKISDPQMLELFSLGEIGVFWVVMVSINSLVAWVSNPVSLVTSGPSKSELDARIGVMSGNFVKRICAAAWALTGLAGVVYFAGRDIAPDRVWGQMASEFLPTMLPGLLGLFIACMLASIMSTCDSMMITASGLFTENLYKKHVTARSEKHYVMVGRLSAVGVVVLGVVFALTMKSVVEALEIVWQIGAMMGITFWLGFFWRGTTVAGAWASALGGFVAFVLIQTSAVAQWMAGTGWGLVFIEGAGEAMKVALPWKIVFYLAMGVVSGVVVSLLTRPVGEDQLERFYTLMRTPVQQGEVMTEPCTLPEGVLPFPRQNLIPSRSFELMKPSRQAVAGFVIGWVIVLAMIGVFRWILPEAV